MTQRICSYASVALVVCYCNAPDSNFEYMFCIHKRLLLASSGSRKVKLLAFRLRRYFSTWLHQNLLQKHQMADYDERFGANSHLMATGN